MPHNLYTSGTTIAGSITSRTLWADTIPEGQTRYYTMRLIGKTDAYEYKVCWRQFTLYNDGTGAGIVNGAFTEIVPDYINAAFTGSSLDLSVTGDIANVTVGEPTTPVDITWNVFLEWDQC